MSTRLAHASYDVTIVGGGMVGSALALALACSPVTRHLRVCLIEATSPASLASPIDPSAATAPSIRVSALSPANAAFFEHLGAWSLMAQKGVSKFTRMRVWHALERGQVEWSKSHIDGESAATPGNVTATPPPSDNTDPNTPAPSSALGFIVENDVIQTSLWRRMLQLLDEAEPAATAAAASTPAQQQREPCNLEILAPVKIERILAGGAATTAGGATGGADVGGSVAAAWPRLVLSNGQEVVTRLLVGADGPNSLVKQFAGPEAIQSFGWEYNQRAVVATLKLPASVAAAPNANTTAFQRFLPQGPIAFLPCGKGYANLVWSVTPAQAKLLCDPKLSGADFVEAVNRAFRAPGSDFQPAARKPRWEHLIPAPIAAVADILFPPASASAATEPTADSLPPLVESVVGPRLSFPLRFLHGAHYVSPRVAYPLAGQGVNLGFQDAQELSQLIARQTLAGNDIGELHNLRPFELARISQNNLMMAAVDTIGKLFATQDGPLAWARAAGMNVFNALPQLKNRAAVVAMGLNTRAPSKQ